MRRRLDLGEIQFYWRMASAPAGRGSGVPALLPFAFSFEARLGLLIQERNPSVADWLRRVYEKDENVGYLQEGHALSATYGGGFLDFLDRLISGRAARPRSMADIGCGGVYLLRALKEKGFDVRGVDPSPVTRRAGERAGIPIVEAFYPVPGAPLRCDLIFHYDVLEHVDDPAAFLRAHRADLNRGGCIAFAVPDCSEHIRRGDIAMVLHEHLNYFDAGALEATLRTAGFRPLMIERAASGGVLYCAAEPDDGVVPSSPADWGRFEAFCGKAEQAMASFRSRVAPLLASGLGIYVPLRALPYLSSMRAFKGARFFDDDPGLRGRYFDGFEAPVESFEDLKRSPVQRMLVASLPFGRKIARKIADQFGDAISVTLWDEILP